MKFILAIASGGALGALARHVISARIMAWFGSGFPWGTFMVNIFGGLLMGVLVELLALRWSMSAEWRAFLIVGFLGSFTTFSSFSLDVILLMERGEMAFAAFYVLGSIVLSVGALFGAMAAFRAILA